MGFVTVYDNKILTNLYGDTGVLSDMVYVENTNGVFKGSMHLIYFCCWGISSSWFAVVVFCLIQNLGVPGPCFILMLQ